MSGSFMTLTGGKDLIECPACSRRFNPNRIKTHEAICQKSYLTERKLFDVSKQRIGGTEFEEITKKLAKIPDSTNPNAKARKGPLALSTNWRAKHEEFLEDVRRKKKSEAEKNRRGNEDLPLCPPLNCDDYVRCPHCQRLFNTPSAERHILTCERVTHERTGKSKEDRLSVSATKISEVNVTEK